MMWKAVGLDFGTTNSAISVVGTDGRSILVSYPIGDQLLEVFRSILYFSEDDDQHTAGPMAIEQYLNYSATGRLIQSMKSFLSSHAFDYTELFGRFYTLDDLIGLLIHKLKEAAEAQIGDIGTDVVVGRPIHFVGATSEEEDTLALERLTSAVKKGGFKNITFEYEPVAAAYDYAKDLTEDELVMIADFGGGTSDFSLIRLNHKHTLARDRTILGSDGVGIAGDAFDAKLIRHLVAPHLGLGEKYRSFFKKILPVPTWLYKNLERWHYVSFLKTPQTLSMLKDVQERIIETPKGLAHKKVKGFIHLIENDLGYKLYSAVEQTKMQLSHQDHSHFVFHDGPIQIEAEVKRSDFNEWIKPELQVIRDCIDRLLLRCRISAQSVDTVFMTGGSSFVPAVRQIFEETLPKSRLRGGGELTTVAKGLALRALEVEASHD